MYVLMYVLTQLYLIAVGVALHLHPLVGNSDPIETSEVSNADPRAMNETDRKSYLESSTLIVIPSQHPLFEKRLLVRLFYFLDTPSQNPLFQKRLLARFLYIKRNSYQLYSFIFKGISYRILNFTKELPRENPLFGKRILARILFF